MELSEIRRKNALKIMKENALDELSFALCLGKDEEQVCALFAENSNKKISDNLAQLIEQTFSKPQRWLDGAELASDGTGPSYDLFG